MAGLFAGIGRLVGFMVGGWLAGWFVCYPVCRLVESSGRPACYIQPITVWPANHPSIYLIANQLTKDCTFISAYIRSVLEFPESGFWRLPFLFGWLVAVGLPDPCLQVAGQVWSVFHLASQGGIPSLLDRLSSDRSGNAQKRVCDLLCHALYIYFLMLHIQLLVLPIPPIDTFNGLK